MTTTPLGNMLGPRRVTAHRIERIAFVSLDHPAYLECTCGTHLSAANDRGLTDAWSRHLGKRPA